MSIAERLSALRAAVDAALERAGAPGREIRIVAVTKGHPAAAVDAVAAAGLLDTGENRVQEALRKAPEVAAPVRWHLVGHLQRNKVKHALSLFRTIHSVDSERLLEALGRHQAAVEVFLQVNVAGESAKHGVRPEEVRPLWRAALRAEGLRVVGLMTMAPYAEDPESARPVFRGLRELRDDLERSGDGPPLPYLSMGMSGDFEVAVEEGATHLRIGTALLRGIVPPSR